MTNELHGPRRKHATEKPPHRRRPHHARHADDPINGIDGATGAIDPTDPFASILLGMTSSPSAPAGSTSQRSGLAVGGSPARAALAAGATNGPDGSAESRVVSRGPGLSARGVASPLKMKVDDRTDSGKAEAASGSGATERASAGYGPKAQQGTTAAGGADGDGSFPSVPAAGPSLFQGSPPGEGSDKWDDSASTDSQSQSAGNGVTSATAQLPLSAFAPLSIAPAPGNAPASNAASLAATVPAQVLRQLSEHLAGNRGETRLVMHLEPPQLGRLTVRLVATEGERVRLHFRVEHAGAGEALTAAGRQIEEVLRAHGLSPDGFSVELASPDAAGLDGGFGQLGAQVGEQTGGQPGGQPNAPAPLRLDPRRATRGGLLPDDDPGLAAASGRYVDYRL